MFTFSFTPPAVKAVRVQSTEILTLQTLLCCGQVFVHRDQACLKLRNHFKAILLHHIVVSKRLHLKQA